MPELHLYDVIRRPVITEESTKMADNQNKYVFEVARQANKIQIKEAVEEIFELEGKVVKVNTMVMPAKRGRRGRKQLYPIAPMEKSHRHAGRRRVDRAVQRLGGSKSDAYQGIQTHIARSP